MKEVTIYTDGACSGNPGNGGYAAVLIYQGVEKIISGGEKDTTNNRMELLGVINGLKALKYKCNVNLYSDSAYVINAINNGWLYNWVNNNWRTADGGEVKNQELWEEILKLKNKHDITFIKVKGHSDNEYNERCDKIAREQYKHKKT